MSIRKLQPSDRPEIERILRATRVFAEAEVAVALELIDIATQRPDQKDYEIYVAERSGCIEGYVCYGPTPCTVGTFDLYWIAVDPARHGSGLGRDLVEFMESDLQKRAARKVIIETSSTPVYEPTRAFYLRRGYPEVARIPDFYKPGDDRIIYAKDL